MKITMRKVDPLPRGIYGAARDKFPERAALLYPAARESFLRLEAATGGLVYSDMWRSAESSLAAMASKRGVQPPGFSAHNYGLAVDVAVDETLKRAKEDYAWLLQVMRDEGWYCHRRDNEQGMESWHFNWLGPDADKLLAKVSPTNRRTWSQAAEENICLRYPELTQRMDAVEIQADLAKLSLYRGELDGQLGPRSQQAAEAFARAWRIPSHGPDFERTLRFVAAEFAIE